MADIPGTSKGDTMAQTFARVLGHTCIVCGFDVNNAPADDDRYYDLIDGVQDNTKLIVCSSCLIHVPALNAEISRVKGEAIAA
jgi:hypothetical protein